MTTLRISIVALLDLLLSLGLGAADSSRRQKSGSALELVGRVRISAVYDVEVAFPYAYALEYGMLHVLDVQDPKAVRELGYLDFDRPRARMAYRHPYLYLTGFGQAMGVVDISDPGRPRWVGEWDELTGTMNDVFELADSLGFLVSTDEGSGQLLVEVLDLSTNAAHPTRVGAVATDVRFAGEYGGISHADGRVYLVVERPADEPTRSRLIVIDVRDPENPQVKQDLALSSGRLLKDIDVRGDLLYALSRQPEQGLVIFQLKPNDELELLGEVSDPRFWFPVDLLVHGPAVYVTLKGEIDVATFDVSDPRAPELRHAHHIPDRWAAGLGMTLVNERLYVTGDGGPAPILDVAEPLSPQLLGYWRYDGGWAGDVARVADLLLVANAGGGVFVVDVSDPRSPQLLTRHTALQEASIGDDGAFSWNVVLNAKGSRAFVAYDEIDAEVLDLSKPAAPRVLGRFRPRGLVNAVALGQSFAFLGYRSRTADTVPDPTDSSPSARGGGIEVVDLTNPFDPFSSATLDLGQPVTDVAFARDLLVAALADGGLAIVDASDLNAPFVTGRILGDETSVASEVRSTRIAVSPDGTMVYSAHLHPSPEGAMYARTGRLAVVDIREPRRPRVVAELPLAHRGVLSYSIAVRDQQVALVAGDLLIVDVSNPISPKVTLRESPRPLDARWDETGLAVDASHVYLTGGEDGVWIYRFPLTHPEQ